MFLGIDGVANTTEIFLKECTAGRGEFSVRVDPMDAGNANTLLRRSLSHQNEVGTPRGEDGPWYLARDYGGAQTACMNLAKKVGQVGGYAGSHS